MLNPTEEELMGHQLENLARATMDLYKDIDSTLKFLGDKGGFANPTTPPSNLVNAENALRQIQRLLDGESITQGNYRAVLNQALPSPR